MCRALYPPLTQSVHLKHSEGDSENFSYTQKLSPVEVRWFFNAAEVEKSWDFTEKLRWLKNLNPGFVSALLGREAVQNCKFKKYNRACLSLKWWILCCGASCTTPWQKHVEQTTHLLGLLLPPVRSSSEKCTCLHQSGWTCDSWIKLAEANTKHHRGTACFLQGSALGAGVFGNGAMLEYKEFGSLPARPWQKAPSGKSGRT